MNVKNTVKTIAYRVKHTLDPGLTDSQIMKRLILTMVVWVYSIPYMAGFILGAYKKINPGGRSLNEIFVELWAVENQLWIDTVGEPVLVKLTISVFYLLFVIGIGVLELAARIGHALPRTLIELFLRPSISNIGFTVIFGVIGFIALFYFVDLVYRAGKGIRGLRGRSLQ